MGAREAVDRAVHTLLDGLATGRGGALFVSGDAGLGKTTVLKQCRAVASDRAMRVGWGTGDPMETSLPFGVVAQAAAELAGQGCHPLELHASGTSVAEGRAARFYRILEWLGGQAASEQVVLILDDLHWADADSLALVCFLCRRIGSLPVAVIGAVRTWPSHAEETFERLAQEGRARVEQLSPLPHPQSCALLRERLHRELPTEEIERACSLCAGNPLLLTVMADALNSREAGPDIAHGDELRPQALLLPRFAGLPPAGMRLLEAASVFGSRFPTDAAVSVARLDERAADRAIDAVTRSGLVTAVDSTLAEFTHPFFRQSLYDNLSPVLRSRLHARAFRLLVQRNADLEAAEHAVRADLAGDPDAVRVLERAGSSALHAGAVSTAANRLELAVMLASRPSVSLLTALGEALLADGRPAQALAVYERVLKHDDVQGEQRVQALRMLGRALFLAGKHQAADRRFEAAAALADEQPGVALEAVLDQCRVAWLTRGPAVALPLAARARELGARAGGRARVRAEATWGLVALMSGDASGLDASLAAAEETATDPGARDLWWNWNVVRNAGRAAKFAERFADSERFFSVLYGMAESTGSPQGIASLAAHHADTLARTGRLEDALALAERATSVADLAPMAEGFAFAVEALVLLLLGRVDAAEASCRRADEAARRRGQWLPRLRVLHLRAMRAAGEGDVFEASDGYRELEAESMRLGIGEPCVVPWARHAVAAHAAAGRQDDAERVIAWAERRSRHLPCTWPRIAAVVGRAHLAGARGRDDDALALLSQAATLHEGLDLPLERVETLLSWGSHLRRRGSAVEARAVLADALSVCDRTGAKWLATEVAAELAASGGRRRRRGSSLEELTPQERRVADLAAAGRTSQEIARHFTLSPRTVETHLGRIYTKLGVHSQRELMARSAADGAKDT